MIKVPAIRTVGRVRIFMHDRWRSDVRICMPMVKARS